MDDDQTAKEKIIAAGISLLERHGLQALTARGLAMAANTSTMTVYSRFGGMGNVLNAVAQTLRDRFGQALALVPHSDDPVADLLLTGAAYRGFALANPERFALMFGTLLGPLGNAQSANLTVTDAAASREQWSSLLNAWRQLVHRMMHTGRIHHDDDVIALAMRIWTVIQGEVTLELAGSFGADKKGLNHVLAPLIEDLLVGMGDERTKASASLDKALTKLQKGTPP